MTRSLLALLLFALVGVAITLFFEQDNGYLLLRYGDVVVETSLVFFCIAVLATVWALIIIWRTLKITFGLPAWLPKLYRRQRNRTARRNLVKGQLLMLEGRWAEAEKALAKPNSSDNASMVSYLNAAIAAQKQSATERRDFYLQQATENDENSSTVAVLLTQAELQLKAGQSSQALASLELLREQQPSHKGALALLLQTCEQLQDKARIRELWPEAERGKVLPEEALQAIAVPAFLESIEMAAEQSLEALDSCWQGLPRSMREQNTLHISYIKKLAAIPEGQPEALRQITRTLKTRWEPVMAQQFGNLEQQDSVAQMAAVEGWIKQHGEQPELQLLAGELCLRNKLWGRARSYLEASIQRQPSAAAWLALGQLNEHTDNLPEAAKAYATGLELALAETQ